MNTKAIVALGSTAVLSLAAGAAGGYFYAKKQLSTKFDQQLQKEVASAKRFYSRLHKQDEHDMPAIVETANMLPVERQAAQAMKRYQGDNTIEETPKEEPIYETATVYNGTKIVDGGVGLATNNVFDTTGEISLENYEALIKNRTEDAPYVITLSEFMKNELNHEQDTLVYFQGDGILVDDQDEIVDVPDDLVGDDNLVKFGHFSGDPLKVFVRNEIIGHDFEITVHEGRYAWVVLGLGPDIESETEPVNAGD